MGMRALPRLGCIVGGILAVAVMTACGAAPGPGEPSTTGTPTPSASSEPSATVTESPSAPAAGLTLRELGFENGPLDEFTLPSDLVISTRVDQPNLVTMIVSRPSPQTIEDYLRSTLPDAGFTIDARSATGGAMTFEGNGWSGGFTGTDATSAIVLRPA